MRIAASWIWTGEGTPFPGALDLDAGRIAAVHRGEASGDLEYPGAVITPGLVNAHCHLDLTLVPSAPRLDRPFFEWLLSVRDRRLEEGPEGLTRAASDGIERLLRSGTTLVVDYDAGGHSLPALAASPIRRVVLREVIDFGRDFERKREELESFLDGEFDAQRECRGLAPHTPFTVHPDMLRSTVNLARERGVPWSMHIAEQPYEDEFLRAGTGDYAAFFERVGIDLSRFPVPGVGPAEYLEESGYLDDAALLVHGNYLDDADVARLGGGAASLVFCPRSHTWFGHQPHPLARVREAGGQALLGTDGMISNGELSMLAELQELRRLFPEEPAADLLALATTSPRQALARAGVDGGVRGPATLAPGSPADLAVFGVDASDAEGVLEGVLNPESSCQATFISGESVGSWE